MIHQILRYLPGDFPWQNQIYWYDTIDSTNTEAKRMASEGAPHGTVLIADRQTAGRGRMGRGFQSPGGQGVYMSVLLRPQCPPERLMHLTCAAAVAMCDAVEEAAGFRPGIKWTNDLVSRGRKLAGILTELVTQPGQTAAIVGIGVNCCQQLPDFDPEIRDFAGSLSMISGGRVDRARVAAAMVKALYRMDETLFTGKEAMLDTYRRDCVTLDKDVSLRWGEETRYGHAFGIDGDGALLVSFPDGHEEAVQSGEVSVRGLYGYL